MRPCKAYMYTRIAIGKCTFEGSRNTVKHTVRKFFKLLLKIPLFAHRDSSRRFLALQSSFSTPSSSTFVIAANCITPSPLYPLRTYPTGHSTPNTGRMTRCTWYFFDWFTSELGGCLISLLSFIHFFNLIHSSSVQSVKMSTLKSKSIVEHNSYIFTAY